MENKLLGYAYLNNEIKEIYSNDYPDHQIEILPNLCVLYKLPFDILHIYKNKKELINETILDIAYEIEDINSELTHLKNQYSELISKKEFLIKSLEE